MVRVSDQDDEIGVSLFVNYYYFIYFLFISMEGDFFKNFNLELRI